jgi:Replication-relaxation
VLRLLLWRTLGLVAFVATIALVLSLAHGTLGAALRSAGGSPVGHLSGGSLAAALAQAGLAVLGCSHELGRPALGLPVTALALALGVFCVMRFRARARRVYVRLDVEAYRGDTASAHAVVALYRALHKRLLARWWRRLFWGQPSISLEIHHQGTSPCPPRGPGETWLAVSCPAGVEAAVEAALLGAYPNCRLSPSRAKLGRSPAMLRLKKRTSFIKRVQTLEHYEHPQEPPVDRLIGTMATCAEPAIVQLALTPAPLLFERYAKHLYKRREARLSRERREHLFIRDSSHVEEQELRGGLLVQHEPLFFADLRVLAASRETCERIASELRARSAENSLTERGTALRHARLGMYDRRVRRGEGSPLPLSHKGVLAPAELAALWHLPSTDFGAFPFARAAVPRAPAPPAIMRPREGPGTLHDALGPVTIHEELRKQNTAVPGAVEQGKSSYLVATVAEDLCRERCAVIVLDPKGDAAEAAVSLVPPERTCTLLDFAHPTCGFNPLAVDAPADVIADYVVGALKHLFTDADIRASSDRYLRNAIIAVLAYDRTSTLWDAARLLTVGEDGYAYRNAVGTRLRTMPEFKEISEFFAAELSAQLADSRSTTTAKLDAPVNKLARLLNSPSIKRVLLNDSLRVNFDRVIADAQVLVVKGALGAMGAGNTSVLMQLLVGMLDAALARQQDLLDAERRTSVALKVDEAPLVLNRGFAETIALKRSAGLETVACWQTDSQWTDREIREQLDALFAHRVYFATSSARDARAAVQLTAAEFSDSVRPETERLSALGRPDVRLHLPKHHAVASWLTPQGRQAAFVAQTIPLHVDRERLGLHTARQTERGGRHLTDLRQPHWSSEHRTRRAPARERPAADERPAARTTEHERASSEDVLAALRAPSATSAPESFTELVELDRAHSVRWARLPAHHTSLDPDPLDMKILGLVAAFEHALTSQLHRRFNSGRALTTTQRRLKRLSDAGLLERFQFHRRDGGGVPMCYVLTASGRQLLRATGGLHSGLGDGPVEPRTRAREPASGRDRRARSADGHRLHQARHDVHVLGWALALELALAGRPVALCGPDASACSPGATSSPRELRLPRGRTPHGFTTTLPDGERRELEHFETLRPDALVEIGATSGRSAIDVMVELDDRLGSTAVVRKLERYDHFLAGWSVHTRRYGVRRRAVPAVVFVCRSRFRAHRCASQADVVLGACRAYAGEYPVDWEYRGREAIAFVSERDIHEGVTVGYGVPQLPSSVRVGAAHGDPAVGRASVRALDILSLGCAP